MSLALVTHPPTPTPIHTENKLPLKNYSDKTGFAFLAELKVTGKGGGKRVPDTRGWE
jgi:hypothetical protein